MSRIKFRAWNEIREEYHLPGKHLWPHIGLDGSIYDDYGRSLYGDSEYFAIEQYTGLKDKNGKEIYEGDIVKDDIGYTGPVVYEGAEFRVRFDSHNIYEVSLGAVAIYGEAEVIGNIHENPELLEDEK